ncbi:MAG: hypothetical protein IKX32_00775 [Bacteroidales bacterium]|nr:hypothetical protein [Bacteroidales bacterium]
MQGRQIFYINNQKEIKKTKKYITIPVLATVTLLLAIGIVVACTKENTNKTTATETPRSAKDLTPSQELAALVFTFWQKSDSAYRADSSTFIEVCKEEDFNAFYDMVNDSEEILGLMGSLVESLNRDGNSPTAEVPLCIPCNMSLGQYGLNVAAMRAVIDELEQYEDPDTVPCFTPYINDSCFLLCHATQGGAISESTAWCLLNCSISKELDRMSIHLAAVKADE